MLLAQIPVADEVLHAHASQLGADFSGYHNHVYRLVNLCAAFAPAPSRPQDIEKIAIAAVFHDLGIWTADTFDYLAPSAALAVAHLNCHGLAEWAAEVTEMILQHHKILPGRAHPDWLTEPFRRADWADVSMGAISFGLPRAFLRELHAAWPSAGFHKRLVQLSFRRLRTHPWSPLPMVRW